MNQLISWLDQPTTTNGLARLAALQEMQALEVQPTSLVKYTSNGSILVIASVEKYEFIKPELTSLDCVHTPLLSRLEGHMGDFRAYVTSDKGEMNLALLKEDGSEHFDLILDLSDKPYFQREMQPFGYFTAQGELSMRTALEQVTQMQGEFEKPKFFEYDENICAHGRRGLEACRRCVDACPAEAITTLVEKISVDPFLCQGGGSCATVCPSGAIRYAYPRLNDSLNRIRRLLQHYRQENGSHPTLLIHDGEAGQAWLGREISRLGDHILPYVVEEVASLGMEAWLACLAFSAHQLVILNHPQHNKVNEALETQLGYAHALLQGMGYDRQRIRFLNSEQDGEQLATPASFNDGVSALPIAAFMLLDEKRYTLHSALEHLHLHAGQAVDVVPLPAGAPFGQVQVNRESCTLCLSCVAVCPAEALSDGKDVPQLNFHEASCVQCGLCSKACPERAITLESRYAFRHDWAQQRRVLHEDEPFRCIQCGKPFATQASLRRIQAQLSHHSMFQSEEQRQRLLMCEDCRVRDIFSRDLQGRV